MVFNGCFISGVRILARRSCFLASTVFHESIFLQDFFSSWCLIMVYKIKRLSRWKKRSRSLCSSRSWFENIDSSEDPFLWAMKENSKATGKCHLFTFLVYVIVCSFCLMSREYDSGRSHGSDPNKKDTKAESKLSSPECKYSEVFSFKSFLTRTVKLLEN